MCKSRHLGRGRHLWPSPTSPHIEMWKTLVAISKISTHQDGKNTCGLLQHLHPSRCGWKDPNRQHRILIRNLPCFGRGRCLWKARGTAEKCHHSHTSMCSLHTRRGQKAITAVGHSKAKQAPHTRALKNQARGILPHLQCK